MTSIELTSKDAISVPCDALVVPVSSAGGTPHVVGDPKQLAQIVKALDPHLESLGMSGACDTVVRVPAPEGVKAATVVLTGIGELQTPLPQTADAYETLRAAAGAASRALAGAQTAVFAFGGNADHCAAVAEGAAFGAYAFNEFKSNTSSTKEAVSEVVIASDLAKDKNLTKRIEEAAILADGVHCARDLVNTPPSHLYPETFAKKAEALGKEYGIKVTVLDDKHLAKNGFGGLTGVGMGSARGPRMAILEYCPRGAKKHVALVGKGVTFDTGGISLKPGQGMETMKMDMAGAAAVLGTIVAAARIGIGVKVTAYLCLAENMPSAMAQRPSDVITIYGGKTVEVLNTDAEGRLVMADGLVLASESDPDAILDIATLTGAQVMALGKHISAVMGDDELREAVVDAATASGEKFWPMPLPKELRAGMDTPVADIANLGYRWGGMLSAGLFLAEFVGKTGGKKAAEDAPRIPWAHLDIAGPAFVDDKPHGYNPKGGTGVGVRTMLGVLRSYEK